MKKSNASIKKHDRVLDIHSRLISGEVIQKEPLATEYGVTQRSIQRDIDAIRDFYSNRSTAGADFTEIKYDHAAKGFRIVNAHGSGLSNPELFAVCKILLESRSLNHEEMERIVWSLVDTCTPEFDKRKITDLIRNELFHYVEPQHGKELLQCLWDLGSAVYSHKIISLEYQKPNGERTKALIKPVGIMQSEYYFYLIAYVGDNDQRHPGFPTIYRVDRIQAYTITKESFHVPYKNRFEEGEFRKRIPFMYGGQLYKVQFKYYGSDINVLLDRLPTAKLTAQNDGAYLVQVEVYGEKGLEMWLLSQSTQVKVISPANYVDTMKQEIKTLAAFYNT